MKVILFCQNAYAFGILEPIKKVLLELGYSFIWYIPEKLLHIFPFKEDRFTTRIVDLQYYRSDAIYVPGNEVPYYLQGLKVQVFHGLAGEKKGHFRIRHYFDLYFTQGPYFTERFNKLRERFKNFEVVETGWPKLDVYAEASLQYSYNEEKQRLLKEFGADTLILYAPTFSPSLTSAPFLVEEIEKLSVNNDYLILIKFHDLMDPFWIDRYQTLACQYKNIQIIQEKNIIKYLMMADLLVSDTSSVIYEFILLDKPVISFRSIAENINWEDSKLYVGLQNLVHRNLSEDPFSDSRKKIIAAFHPYNDGASSMRIVQATQSYIEKHGVPEMRKLSTYRKIKINYIFGKPIKNLFDGVKRNKISALLITYNEILHIEQVLENLKFADEIIVVDSFSTDGTAEVIREHPRAKLIQRPFVNFTDQKSYALTQATNDWLLFTDADERIPDSLKNEILNTVNGSASEVVAYYFKRRFMFRNKQLRFSGWQSDKNFRLFRKSKCKFTKNRIVHETLEVDGQIAVLKNILIHYSYRDYLEYKAKMIRYGNMKAKEEFKKGKRSNWLLRNFRPAYRFLNHFFLRLGFLDGSKGLIISYLNALGVYARYKEMERLARNNEVIN